MLMLSNMCYRICDIYIYELYIYILLLNVFVLQKALEKEFKRIVLFLRCHLQRKGPPFHFPPCDWIHFSCDWSRAALRDLDEPIDFFFSSPKMRLSGENFVAEVSMSQKDTFNYWPSAMERREFFAKT